MPNLDIQKQLKEWESEGKLAKHEWQYVLCKIPNLSHNNKNVCLVMQTIHSLENLPERENIIATLAYSMLNTQEIDSYMLKIFKILLQYHTTMNRPVQIITNNHWKPRLTDKLVRDNLLELFKDNENLCRNIETLIITPSPVQKEHEAFLNVTEKNSSTVCNKDGDGEIVTSDIKNAP